MDSVAAAGHSLIEVMLAIWVLVLFQLLLDAQYLALQTGMLRLSEQLAHYLVQS